jgi:translation initiation factor eIF-2B subunit gamma
MHTSASDLFWIFFTASQRSTLSEKSSCHGYAKFNTKERSRKSMGEVVIHSHYWGDKLTIFSSALRSIPTEESHAMARQHSTLFEGSILAQDPSSRGSNSPSLKSVPFSVTSSPTHPDVSSEPLASLRIGMIVHDTNTTFVGRVNNVATLLEANRQVRFFLYLTRRLGLIVMKFLSRTNYTLPTDPDNRVLIDAKSRISSDSMIGSSTKIGERATITRSIIGRHCVIGKMSRVVGCVLLDHCVVSEG